MRRLFCSLSGLVLAAGAANAQPAGEPGGDTAQPEAHAEHAASAEPAAPAVPSEPATPADPATNAAAEPAEPAMPASSANPATPSAPPVASTEPAPATPAQPAAPAAPAIAVADVTEAEIDSFAKATVKLQSIQADATIAPDQKQTAMQAAVAEAGLDPAKYNAIGQAVQGDPALRAKVQTAMARHTTPAPSDG